MGEENRGGGILHQEDAGGLFSCKGEGRGCLLSAASGGGFKSGVNVLNVTEGNEWMCGCV